MPIAASMAHSFAPMDSDNYPPREALEAAFRTVHRARVPQIADLVHRLRDELSRPEPSLKLVASLIEQDLALTGQVLKAINSPLFACRTKISCIRQAVTMMGVRRLTNLVTAEAISRMLGVKDGAARVVWEHIMEQARVAVSITRFTREVTQDEAYLFAVMQDVGSLIFVDLLRGYGAEWVLQVLANPQSLTAYERTALGTDHLTVGFLLAGNWRLPEPVALAIYHHHDPDPSRYADRQVRALVSIANLTHYLLSLSQGIDENEALIESCDLACHELSLTEADWSTLCAQAAHAGWRSDA